MENCVEKSVETRKEWVAPELKKVEVEKVTSKVAFHFGDS